MHRTCHRMTPNLAGGGPALGGVAMQCADSCLVSINVVSDLKHGQDRTSADPPSPLRKGAPE